MSDAWTWTMERQLTVGRRGGLGGEDKRQKKKKWDNCNRIKKIKINK